VTEAWEAAIRDWEQWMRAAHRPPTTVKLRTYQLRRLADDHPDREPWSLTLTDLAVWLGGHAWAAETMRSYRASLRTFYAWALLIGYIERSPAALLPAIRPPRRLPRPTPEEILRQALATASERERIMVMLAAYEGLRRGEIARVHSRDVESDPEGGWRLRVLGKGGHERRVPLSPAVFAALRTMAPGWAFPGQIDGHLSPEYVGKIVSRLLPPGWTTHTLRHRFATRLRAGGVQLDEIQDLLGHAKLETVRIYTEVPSGALRAAVMTAA
jgi:integrase/recombinase XerC